MNRAQQTTKPYTIKSYFDQPYFYIVRTDGDLAHYRSFPTPEAAEQYASQMDPINFR